MVNLLSIKFQDHSVERIVFSTNGPRTIEYSHIINNYETQPQNICKN